MKNLIPNPFRSNKLNVWKQFNLFDLLVFIITIIICFLFFGFLPIDNILKIILIVLFSIILNVVILSKSKNHNCRIYILFWRKILFTCSIKKFSKKPINFHEIKKSKLNLFKSAYTDDLIPFEKFESGTIGIVKSKNLNLNIVDYITGIKIKGLDITNLNQDEIQLYFDNLQNLFKSINFRITIIKTSNNYDFHKNREYVKNKILKTNNLDKDKKFVLEEINSSFDEYEFSFEQIYYNIFVYGKNKEQCIDNVENLSSVFENEGFENEFLSKAEIININYNIINGVNNFVLEDSLFEKEINDQENEEDKVILSPEDILAPDKLIVKSTHLELQENEDKWFMNIQNINKFPLEINNMWIQTLFNTPSTIVMHLNPVPTEIAKKEIHKSTLNIKVNQIQENQGIVNEIENSNIEDSINHLAEKIASGEEFIKKIQVFFVNISKNKKDLERLMKWNKDNLSNINCNLSPLIYLQFKAFQNIFLKSTDNLREYQEIPDSTLAAGWPFASPDFNDENGFVVGNDNSNSGIVLDIFKQNNQRTNHNMMILGTSGSGKSSFTKKLALYYVADGANVIMIDPEDEYKYLLKEYGGILEGNILKLGGDGETFFNPLDIYVSLEEENIEYDLVSSKDKMVKNQVEWFGNWFKLLFIELEDKDIRFLERNLLELYNDWFKTEVQKINLLKQNQYPIISDLFNWINKQKILIDDINYASYNKIKEIISHHFINGKLGEIYNKHSNFQINSNLTIFDTQSIFNNDNGSTARAGFNIILSKIQNWLIMNYKKSLKERFVLIIDEAHMLLDKDNPATISFLHRTVKRIRKYNGSVILTTQNPGDFVDSGDSKKLAGILNNIQYSMIFKMKSNDVQSVDELYKSLGGLTELEKQELVRLKRGSCLFNPSAQIRKFVQVNYSEFEKSICFSDYVPNDENEFKDVIEN